jgi:phytoene synthase
MNRARYIPDLADAIALAKAYDPDRYIAATLAPQPERAALIALAGFAGDLTRIVETAREPLLGEIRLQWWRDGLQTLAEGGRTGAPLADALGDTVVARGLPVALLVALTEARAFDLYDDAMATATAFDGYLDKTQGGAFEVALRIMGVAAGDAGDIGRAAGRLYGMTQLLARLPAHLAAARLPLPPELLQEHGVTPATMLAGTTTPAVRALLAAVIRDISATHATLRPRIMALSRRHRVALLPLALILPYLRVIGSLRRDPLRDVAELAPLTRVWHIAHAHWSSTR